MKTEKAWALADKDTLELESHKDFGFYYVHPNRGTVPVLVLIGADSIAELAELRDKAQRFENLQAEIEKRVAKLTTQERMESDMPTRCKLETCTKQTVDMMADRCVIIDVGSVGVEQKTTLILSIGMAESMMRNLEMLIGEIKEERRWLPDEESA